MFPVEVLNSQMGVDDVNERLVILLDESRERQQWCIAEAVSQGIRAKKSGKFSSADSRSLPKPSYPPGSVVPSKRVEIDRSEAQRLLPSFQERVEIAKDLQTFGWDSDFKWFKAKTDRPYLKFNLFKNIKSCGEIPKTPEIKSVRIPSSKADNSFLKIDWNIEEKRIKIEDMALLDQRISLLFTIPEKFLENHSGEIRKISRPTIRLDGRSNKAVFDFTLFEEIETTDNYKDSVLGVDVGVNKMVSMARVYKDGRYSEEFTTSKETDRLTKKIRRDNLELDRKRSKQKARKALGIENREAEKKIEELTAKKFRRQKEQEWLIARDVVDHSILGETIAMENLSFNSGGSVGDNKRFRFRGIQDKIEHSAKRRKRKTKKINAKGTSSDCPNCGDQVSFEGRISVCTSCQWREDRDYSASISGAKKGLGKSKGSPLTPKKNKPTPKRPRKTPRAKYKNRMRTINTVVDPAIATGRRDPEATIVSTKVERSRPIPSHLSDVRLVR